MNMKRFFVLLIFITIIILMVLLKPELYWQQDDKLFKKAINTLETKYCYEIKDEMKSDYCLYKIANLTNSYEYCQKLKTDYWKAICNINFIKKLKNESLCKKIVYPKDRFNCYSLLAEATQDIAYCNYTLSRNACIYDVAVKNLNISICFNLERVRKDICILKIAKGLNDPELCNNIGFNEIRESCINYFAKNTS